ncbi:MauE/DoxX family redox-associated membrane protein [Streptomyces sp. SM11]|uniref:MauE/DoxX family redox-associated membrane protein n=1 Tax=Streptomyces sp. SM11 TaxID=565557 RepID=UPI0021565AA0|nr:MauE/DoxX family redox-associated membrane protein [Streptomyces sp. SM11]
MRSPWIGTGARIALAGVWCWAGWAMFLHPETSVYAVRAYRALPEGLVHAVGYGLPVLELALAVLLATGLMTRFAAALSALLLVAFLVAIIQAWARGMSIDCGCFGGGGAVDPGQTQYAREIIRDLAFLSLSVLLIRRPRTRLSVDAVLP